MSLCLSALLMLTLTAGAFQDSKSASPFDPPAEVKRLSFFEGQWDVDQTAYMPGSTEGQKSRGAVQCQWILQGRFMSYRFQTDFPGMGPYEGLLLITYDPEMKKYRSWWYNSASAQVAESVGEFHEGKLVLTSSPQEYPGMGMMSMRTTYEPKSGKGLLFTLEMQTTGKWETAMVSDFKPAKEKPAASEAAPSPEMKKVEFLVGKARGKDKMLVPGQTTEYDSETVAEWLLRGAFITGTYRAEMPGYGKMEGLMVTTYDPNSKSYLVWWFSNSSPHPMETSGNFDGTKLVLVSKPFRDPMGVNNFRITFDSNLKNSPNYRMEMKMGETWTPILESTFTKQ